MKSITVVQYHISGHTRARLIGGKTQCNLNLGNGRGECLALSADKAASLLIGQNVGWAPESVWILRISLPLPEAKPRFLGCHTQSLNRTMS